MLPRFTYIAIAQMRAYAEAGARFAKMRA